LELWLGDDNYGGNCTAATFAKFFDPSQETGMLPRLEYLGLRNCDTIDTLMQSLCESHVIKRLRIVDVSLGTLSKDGAQHILKLRGPEYQLLELFDIHHHFVNDDALLQDLLKMPFIVDVSGLTIDSYRYIAVGE